MPQPLNLGSYTKWTETAICFCVDDRLILITAFVAVPPDIRTILVCNSLWIKILVSFRSFENEIRVSGSQIIKAFPYSLSGAIRTAVAICSISYPCFPFVAVFADP